MAAVTGSGKCDRPRGGYPAASSRVEVTCNIQPFPSRLSASLSRKETRGVAAGREGRSLHAPGLHEKPSLQEDVPGALDAICGYANEKERIARSLPISSTWFLRPHQ